MPAPFRLLFLAVFASGLLLSPIGRAQQLAATNAPGSTPPPANAPDAALTSPTDGAKKKMADAMKQMNANDLDGALTSLSEAIKLNPSSTGAYVLRASIYCQKKLWPQAENDFNTAAKLAPKNVVLKFNLAEVKFLQKQYDVARPGFVALEKDPDMGDFASFKVFLCDLFGGHEEAAKKELDVFNDAMGNPSYDFGNAAWYLVHKDTEKARSWLASASRTYSNYKLQLYSDSLRNLGYLPIPPTGDVVNPPATTAAAPH